MINVTHHNGRWTEFFPAENQAGGDMEARRRASSFAIQCRGMFRKAIRAEITETLDRFGCVDGYAVTLTVNH